MSSHSLSMIRGNLNTISCSQGTVRHSLRTLCQHLLSTISRLRTKAIKLSTRTSISRKTRLQQLALAMNLMRLLPSTLLYLLELLLAANFRMLVLQVKTIVRCQWWMQLEQSHQGMDQRRESPWTRFEKPKSNLLIFQRTPVQVRAGTGQGYHRIYIGVRTIPGPSGSVFYFVPKDPNDNSKGGIARIGQHQNMLPPPRTFMTSPDDWRPSSQGRQLWMYDYGV
ncbi:hypothetical protein LTS06_012017, partial [Exophiala xenobiotica]